MSLQRTIARLLLKLPDPFLVTMAGGKKVEMGGRTLDARFQFIANAASKAPAPVELTPAVGRAGTEMLTFMFGGKPETGVTVTPIDIPAEGRVIPGRAYRPASQNPKAPLLVFFHFGGGVVGSLETCHAFCTILANAIGCPVLSVDYRLAPEHQWPSGLDDCLAAYRWGRDNAAHFGAPTGVAAVGGDSMGGNFAAIIAQDLRAAGEPQPFLQLLIYPATDITDRSPSMTTYAQAFPLTADTMAWFMANYVPEGADHSDVRLSPMKAKDLSGLAPAIVVTAGFDPLDDQGRLYHERLEAAGVPSKYRCYDSLAHGFTTFTGGVPAADAACRQIADDVARAYTARLA